MSVILISYDLLVTKPIGTAQNLFYGDACISCVFIASFFFLSFLSISLFIYSIIFYIELQNTYITYFALTLLQYQI